MRMCVYVFGLEICLFLHLYITMLLLLLLVCCVVNAHVNQEFVSVAKYVLIQEWFTDLLLGLQEVLKSVGLLLVQTKHSSHKERSSLQ